MICGGGIYGKIKGPPSGVVHVVGFIPGFLSALQSRAAIQAAAKPLKIGFFPVWRPSERPETGLFWALPWRRRLFCPPDVGPLSPTEKGRAGRVAGPQGWRYRAPASRLAALTACAPPG